MTFHPDPLDRDANLLRRLAHRLIPDPDAADDATQSVALAWLQKRPQGVRNLRAWWIGALRMERLKWLERRPRRIAEDVEPEQLGDARPDADDPAARELRALIEREARALSEPYASVVCASLFEERSLEEIARHLGRPAGTVRAQHLRGLEQLRARLDRALGSRGAWVVVLLPWRRTEPSGAPLEASPLHARAARSVLSRAWIPAAGLLLIAWIARPLALRGTAEGTELAAVEPAPAREPSTSAPVVAVAPVDETGRSARSGLPVESVPVAGQGSDTPPAPDARRFRLRVVDEDGTGLEEVSIRLVSSIDHSAPFSPPPSTAEIELARTGWDGRAVVELTPGLVQLGPDGAATGQLALRRSGYFELGQHRVRWDPKDPDDEARIESYLCMSRAPLQIEFRILDAAGESVPDAQIAIELNAPERGLPLAQELSLESGALVLRGEGAEPPRTLECTPGTHRFAIWSPTRGIVFRTLLIDSSRELEFRIEQQRVVRGTVYDPVGTPLAGARVWFDPFRYFDEVPWDWCSTRSDADGRYVLNAGDSDLIDLWGAHMESGLEPISRLLRSPAGLEDIDLHLGDDDPIALRLLDPQGAPLAHWRVGLFVNRDGKEIALWRFTDAQGCTRFAGARQDHLRLAVYGPAPGRFPALLALTDYRPPSGEHDIVVALAHAETCAILGQVTTLGWEPKVPLSIAYGNPGFSSMGSHVLGAFGEPFAIENLSPGRVLLLLLGEPAFVLPLGEHTLEPGGFLDLGEIVLGPPGTVRFAADPPGDFESKVFDVRLSSLLTPGNAKSALGFDQWPSGTYELFAGDYRVVLTGQGIGVLRAEFAVRSGEETLVIVRR